jgi:hypothetical protein
MNEIMEYQELKERLQAIPNPQERALLCTIYACMARVSEIVGNSLTKRPGISTEDGAADDRKLILKIMTLKVNKPRKIPLFRNRESWLIDEIEEWAAGCQGLMFPRVNRWKAQRIFKKHFPEFSSNRTGNKAGSKHTIHWLRGWRYTHYRRGNVTGKIVESRVAALLGGWVSSATPERYYDFTKIDDFEAELENKPSE